MDYLLPTTTDVPNFEIHHLESVLLDPDVNFRGVGEGGMIVAPAAIVNAIEDALAAVRCAGPRAAPARRRESSSSSGSYRPRSDLGGAAARPLATISPQSTPR